LFVSLVAWLMQAPAETPAVELDEQHSDGEELPLPPVPAVTLEAQEAGIKVVPSITKPKASSSSAASSSVPLTSQFFGFLKKHRLFSVVMISHILLLLSATVAMSLIPNDVGAYTDFQATQSFVVVTD
jgi:hypothetical protein